MFNFQWIKYALLSNYWQRIKQKFKSLSKWNHSMLVSTGSILKRSIDVAGKAVVQSTARNHTFWRESDVKFCWQPVLFQLKNAPFCFKRADCALHHLPQDLSAKGANICQYEKNGILFSDIHMLTCIKKNSSSFNNFCTVIYSIK